MSAKSIMIQGTMSSAGKSFITAGLCRIFYQDGLHTVPFKSQNMALNSYITKDGLEMGRAQVMQAEASGVEPDIRMNPILLKPTSDRGSQVIVDGEIFGTMTATEYYKKKQELIPHIMKSYRSLAEENDVIVLEGAGSPAEINLKDVDIVNMGMAKLSDSPVILVGDIDRGGVFASIYGTIALLDEEERKRVKGIIINKFRGDKKILDSGLEMIEELTGVKVLGVVPYIPITLDDEDSLSDNISRNKNVKGATVDIAIIRLPRISNSTDFEIFKRLSKVSVRYVKNVSELGEPDIIFIPGTKSTMSDLKWLRQNGLESAILKRHQQGSIIFGICGGFQMLGQTISDPENIECGGSMRGIGLLDTATTFRKSKKRSQTRGKMGKIDGVLKHLSDMEVSGYEIHMGETENCGKAQIFTKLENGETDGYMNTDGTVFGTYLHGIFDSNQTAFSTVKELLKQKGSNSNIEFDLQQYKEEQYNKLAEILRENLDIEYIYSILNGTE